VREKETGPDNRWSARKLESSKGKTKKMFLKLQKSSAMKTESEGGLRIRWHVGGTGFISSEVRSPMNPTYARFEGRRGRGGEKWSKERGPVGEHLFRLKGQDT